MTEHNQLAGCFQRSVFEPMLEPPFQIHQDFQKLVDTLISDYLSELGVPPQKFAEVRTCSTVLFSVCQETSQMSTSPLRRAQPLRTQ